MDSSNPATNPLGDIESFESLALQYTLCENDEIKDIQCRVSGTNISFHSAGQYGVICDLNRGLHCLHSMQTPGKINHLVSFKDVRVLAFIITNLNLTFCKF